MDYSQAKNGTPLFFSHTPAPCRYSNLLPPLIPPLWSMKLKQGGREGPSVPTFDPTGAVSAQPWGLYFTGLQTWYPAQHRDKIYICYFLKEDWGGIKRKHMVAEKNGYFENVKHVFITVTTSTVKILGNAIYIFHILYLNMSDSFSDGLLVIQSIFKTRPSVFSNNNNGIVHVQRCLHTNWDTVVNLLQTPSTQWQQVIKQASERHNVPRTVGHSRETKESRKRRPLH